MSFTANPMMNAIATKLAWLSTRQATISQNLANANTPGYQAREVAAPDFAKLLQKKDNAARALKAAGLRQTSDKHLKVGGDADGIFDITVDDRKPVDSKLTGNNVVLEEHMIDMAPTQIEHAAIVNVYGRQVGLLTTALGKRGSYSLTDYFPNALE